MSALDRDVSASDTASDGLPSMLKRRRLFGCETSSADDVPRSSSDGVAAGSVRSSAAPVASTEPAVSSASSQVLAPALEPRDDSIVPMAPGSLLKRRRSTRPAQEDSTTSGVRVVDGRIVRPSRVRDDTAMPQRGRIVSGFGNERSEDVVADRALVLMQRCLRVRVIETRKGREAD